MPKPKNSISKLIFIIVLAVVGAIILIIHYNSEQSAKLKQSQELTAELENCEAPYWAIIQQAEQSNQAILEYPYLNNSTPTEEENQAFANIQQCKQKY